MHVYLVDHLHLLLEVFFNGRDITRSIISLVFVRNESVLYSRLILSFPSHLFDTITAGLNRGFHADLDVETTIDGIQMSNAWKW